MTVCTQIPSPILIELSQCVVLTPIVRASVRCSNKVSDQPLTGLIDWGQEFIGHAKEGEVMDVTRRRPNHFLEGISWHPYEGQPLSPTHKMIYICNWYILDSSLLDLIHSGVYIFTTRIPGSQACWDKWKATAVRSYSNVSPWLTSSCGMISWMCPW